MPKMPKVPHRGVGPYGPEAKIVEFCLIRNNHTNQLGFVPDYSLYHPAPISK